MPWVIVSDKNSLHCWFLLNEKLVAPTCSLFHQSRSPMTCCSNLFPVSPEQVTYDSLKETVQYINESLPNILKNWNLITITAIKIQEMHIHEKKNFQWKFRLFTEYAIKVESALITVDRRGPLPHDLYLKYLMQCKSGGRRPWWSNMMRALSNLIMNTIHC